MVEYSSVEKISNKTLKAFTKSLVKKGLDNISTGAITDKEGKIKFLEAIILNRKLRYSNSEIMKKIPKKYRGIPVKAL